MATVSKKFIGCVDDCVDDFTLGYVAANPHLRAVKGYRVVVREDVAAVRSAGRVALICGGGSGHEPCFAGYVGRGSLTAAVAGSVFTSPPPSHILAALSAARSEAGIIVLVINYTGDRLNFGVAVEKAKHLWQKMPIKMVVMGEDCALTTADKTAGRRGLAGSLFVIKIAGAMAEQGTAIDAIAETAADVTRNAGTIGLSLSSCSLPGSEPLFQLSSDEMELGLGIHGEPGVKRMKILNARDSVDAMLSHMTDPNSSTQFKLSKDKPVAVLLNNLGGVSQIEMGILSKEVFAWLGSKGVTVQRFYAGTFMTSLEMHGISVSLLNVIDPKWLDYLDEPTSCTAWPKTPVHPNHVYSLASMHVDVVEDFKEVKHRESTLEIDKAYADKLKQCIVAACDSLISSESTLNSLDSSAGDGDCGSTLRRGAEGVKKAALSNSLPFNRPADLLHSISSIFENTSGGTTGAIYSLFFNGAAKHLIHSADAKNWIDALKSGTEAVMRYGGAEPGDRTLVDTLWGAVKFALSTVSQSASLDNSFYDGFLKAAKAGADSTTSMVARAGRASYVSKENLTKPDAGAMAVFLLLNGIVSGFRQ